MSRWRTGRSAKSPTRPNQRRPSKQRSCGAHRRRAGRRRPTCRRPARARPGRRRPAAHDRQDDDQPRAQPMEIASETIAGPTTVEVAEVYEPASEPIEPATFRTEPEPVAVEVSAGVLDADLFGHDAGAAHDGADDAHAGEAHDHAGEAGAASVEAAEDDRRRDGRGRRLRRTDARAAAAGNRGRRCATTATMHSERRIPPRFLRNYKIQEVIQPPADPAGAGGEGGARHQGRGADHLHLARRPVLRADAELAARRRHLAQDHLGRRPAPAEGGHRRAGNPAGHGPDRAHRRRQPPEAGDQARLRIPAAAVGRHPRAHAEVGRAGADLRGSQPDQARHPRRLFARHRRDPGGRRGRLAGGARVHAHADAEPRQEGAALARRRPAAVQPSTRWRRSSTPCCSRPCSCAPAAIW